MYRLVTYKFNDYKNTTNKGGLSKGWFKEALFFVV